MYTSETFSADIGLFKKKLLLWSDSFEPVCFLDSNNYSSPYTSFNLLAGFGCVDELKSDVGCLTGMDAFYNRHITKDKNYLFGFLSYDLKNESENLSSANLDGIQFPVIHFFVPEIVFEIKNRTLEILVHTSSGKKAQHVFEEIISFECSLDEKILPVTLASRISRQEYIKTIKKIKQHIQLGDVYELNFCQEFYSENVCLNPKTVYEKLNMLSPAPMSCFYKTGHNYLMSTSPERFLKRTGDKIISQPIKGTAARGKTKEQDEYLKQQLYNDEKERSENVMIVDLVRNDLSRIASGGSVHVDELFGVYTFSQMHQMISTISCNVKKEVSFTDVMKSIFPMGSMTGAPKIRAMQLIEQYEKTKRGLFSGAVGYVLPNGDYDFNVVIRGLLYNETKKYVSLSAGGAITAKSIPEAEYDECLLKAQAMMHVLGNT